MTENNSNFNNEAEIGVLSILLANPDLAEAVQLRPQMFGSALSPNYVIFNCMYELIAEGLVPEYSLVISKLESNGNLQKAGGRDYVDYLKKCEGFSKNNLSSYTKAVTDAYKARSSISLMEDAKAKLHGGKDVTETIYEVEKGLASLQDGISDSDAIDIGTATTEAWEAIKEKMANPGITGIRTGLESLDLITGGYNVGKLWIVAGRPGMGKSADMCNTVLLSAKHLLERGQNEWVIIFTLEMTKEELVQRMLAIHTGIPLQDIMFGNLDQKQIDQLKEAGKYFKTLPILIDENPGTDEQRFVSVVRRYNHTRKIRMVFFDYLQLGTDRDEGQTAALGRLTQSAKKLAKEIDATCVFYSQLNRSVESRDDKRPILSDLRQSGNIEEDADLVIFLYRDEYYNPDSKAKGIMEHDIKKHRNGKLGMFVANFVGENMRVYEKT